MGAIEEKLAQRVRPRRVGFYVNLEREAARAALDEIESWLQRQGVETFLLVQQASALGRADGVSPDRFYRDAELVVSLGGDGTFLHAARMISGTRPAILGANFGRLGYLTAVEAGDLCPFLAGVLTEGIPVQHRLRLSAGVRGWDSSPPALNDVVVQDAEGVRTQRLLIRTGEDTVGVFLADGVIVATPTGSTAYTLSVGGPVVHPGVEAILLALVSPHTLSARPMVVPANEKVSIQVLGERPIRVTIDGQETRTLSGEAPIEVSRGADVAVVIDPSRTFIHRLREKLSWGGNPTP